MNRSRAILLSHSEKNTKIEFKKSFLYLFRRIGSAYAVLTQNFFFRKMPQTEEKTIIFLSHRQERLIFSDEIFLFNQRKVEVIIVILRNAFRKSFECLQIQWLHE